MADAEETTRIAGSPDQVWAALGNFGSIARWAPNVDHSCLTTSQDEGVGTERRVQVGRNTLLERVVEWESGQRLAYSIEGLPPVARSVVTTWVLAGDDRSTSVTLTSQIVAGQRPPQQVAARVFAKVLAKSSREMLGGLKQYVEQTKVAT